MDEVVGNTPTSPWLDILKQKISAFIISDKTAKGIDAENCSTYIIRTIHVLCIIPVYRSIIIDFG